MSQVRPIQFDQHPLVEQKYILPTPSIEELYQRVLKIIRLRTPGAIIYAHPRFGKTYSIRYILRVLKMDMPGVVTLSFGCRKSKSHSEDMFFATLLHSVGHPAADSGSIARKRTRLSERIAELVERSRYNIVVAFADEAPGRLHPIIITAESATRACAHRRPSRRTFGATSRCASDASCRA